MGKYVIVATRKPAKEREDASTTVGALKKFFEGAGWVVLFKENASSIFEVYSEGVKELDVRARDQVVLCHDDIEIMASADQFNKMMDEVLSSTTGFAGVAGSAVIDHLINWFQCSMQYKEHNVGGGVVYHGIDTATMIPSFYGQRQLAVSLDGLFLATTGRVLHTIQLKMPQALTSPWDHYDAFYCIQAHIKGFENKIIPLAIRHESGGRYPPVYQENVPVMARLFEKNLPLNIRELKA